MTAPAFPPKFFEQLKSLAEQGQLKKARQGCETVLKQDPDNAEAKSILADIERREGMLAMGGVQSFKVVSLTCPNCKSSVAPSEDARGFVCGSCGSILERAGEGAQKVGSVNLKKFPPRSVIHLGREGKIFDRKVQVIGRLRYDAAIKEWDDEDNIYTDGSWSFDEWMLVDENKQYIFIEEDEEGYKVFQKFAPSNPQTPNLRSGTVTIETQTGSQRILEEGLADLVFFEGEFTWVPSLGDQIRYWDIGTGKQRYAVEQQLSDRGEAEEIEFFRGKDLSEQEIFEIFNCKEKLAEVEQKKAAAGEYRRWAIMFLIIGVLLMFFGCSRISDNPRVVLSESSSFADIGDDGKLLGPFQLTKVGTFHSLELSASFDDNKESSCGVEILDSEQNAINAVEGDFWRESGSDDEGSWSESDLSRSEYFKLSEAGTYYLRLFIEPGSAPSGTVKVRLLEGIQLARFYILFGLASFAIGGSLWKFNTMNPVYWIIGLFIFGFAVMSMFSRMSDD